jgi:hypothetical protein
MNESAATPDGEDLAAAMDALESAALPEVQMSARASECLNNARMQVSEAHDALTGREEPRWQGLGLGSASADHLRAQLKVLAGDIAAIARVIDRMEGRGGG